MDDATALVIDKVTTGIDRSEMIRDNASMDDAAALAIDKVTTGIDRTEMIRDDASMDDATALAADIRSQRGYKRRCPDQERIPDRKFTDDGSLLPRSKIDSKKSVNQGMYFK